METSFFGSFSNANANDSAFVKIRNSEHTNLIKIEPEHHFTNDTLKCFAWGRFYDLRKTCIDLGIEYTGNPCEALSAAFSGSNYQALDLFYGEFTFILIRHDLILIGRDHAAAGLPVFYNDHFYSNNIDDFKAIPGFDFSPDLLSVQYFLHLGAITPPNTIIKGIKQLPAGCMLIHTNNTIKIYSLHSFEKYASQAGTLKITEEEAAAEIERLHQNALKRRINDKKKIAFLLSGGYDSGGNLAAFRAISEVEAKGYSIGFKDDPWSELPLASLLAKTFNLQFNQYQIDGSEINELPAIMGFFNNPFQENGLMVNYTVMKMLRNEGNDIILGGDGNDQVYGTGMQEMALHYLSSVSGLKPFQHLISAFTKMAGTKSGLLTKVDFHNRRVLEGNSHTSFGFSLQELNRLLENPETGKIKTNIIKSNGLKIKSFDDNFIASGYFKSLMNDGFDLIIFKAAGMSRLFDQPLSFPYMDKDILDFVSKLPRQMRVAGTPKEIAKGAGKSKYLHKKYLKSKLPAEITERKKQGGFAPLPIFFKDDKQRNLIFQIIRNSGMAKSLFNLKYLEHVLSSYEQIANSENVWFWHRQSMAFRIFNLLTLAVWWDIHFNGKTGKTLKEYI
jgi:asparagine synthase (glutamine-hydrolysing)